jgi:carbamoylphosphate synthase large subunit
MLKLGTPISAIIQTEDRQLFADKLAEVGESAAKVVIFFHFSQFQGFVDLLPFFKKILRLLY